MVFMRKSLTKTIIATALFATSGLGIYAATYSYGTNITSNGKTLTAYTAASNDNCSVTTHAYYILSSTGKLADNNFFASRDPNTGQANIIKNASAYNARYFTQAVSTHKVGNNTYKSSDVYNQ